MFKYFEILEDLIFQFSISLDLSLHDYKVESNELRSHCDAPDDPVVEESDESICLAAIDAALNKASIARLKRSELTIPISSSAINSVSVNEESKSLSSKKPSSTTRSKLVKHLPEEATLPTSRNNEKYRAFQRPAIASRRIPLQDVKSLRNRCLGLGNLGSKQRVHPQEPAFRLPCISSDHKNPSPTELPATNSAHVCAAASFARADICTTNLEPSSSVTNRSQSVGPSHIPPSLSAPQHRSNSNADIAAGLCCTQDRTRAASRSQTQSLRSRSASTRERVSTLVSSEERAAGLKRLRKAMRRNAQLRAECHRWHADATGRSRSSVRGAKRAFIEQLEAARDSTTTTTTASACESESSAGQLQRWREQLMAECECNTLPRLLRMPPSTLHSADRESARATTEWEMRELLLASRVLQRAIRACLSIDAALREQLEREPRPPRLPPPANPKHVTPSPSPCAGPGPGASRVYHYTLPFSATSCSAIARGHSVPDSSARKPNARATLRAHFAQLDIALAAMLNEQLARASAVE